MSIIRIIKDRIVFEEGFNHFDPPNLNEVMKKDKATLQYLNIVDTQLEGPTVFSAVNIVSPKDVASLQTGFINDALKGIDETRSRKANLEERYKDDLKKLAFYYFMSCARYSMAKKAHVVLYAPFTNEQLSVVIDNGYRTKEEIASVRGFGAQFKKNYLDAFVENVNFFYDNIDKHADLEEYISQLKAKRTEIKKEYDEEMVIWSKIRPIIETE